MNIGHWRPRLAGYLVSGLTTLLLTGAWAAPASANAVSNSENANTGSPAVVGSLLDMFSFGDTVGMPLACDASASLLSAASASASPIATELSSECAQLSQAGETWLQQAQSESSALVLVNPVADPAIAALASTVQTTGNNYGSSLTPFGPTVAGLGGTIAFFEGS